MAVPLDMLCVARMVADTMIAISPNKAPATAWLVSCRSCARTVGPMAAKKPTSAIAPNPVSAGATNSARI